MAGLADLFGGGGGMFGSQGAGMYGDLLTPEMRQQMAFRGLMAAAGALGQAGMPSRMPVPLGAALGQAAGAMSGAEDKGLENALNALLTRGKLQEMQGNLEIDKQIFGQAGQQPPMLAPGASTAGVPPAAAPAIQAGGSLGGGMAAGGALAPKSGGVTLAEAKAAARRAGFDEEGASIISAISVPESSLNPNAYNPKDPAGGSFGLTQINGVHPGAREAMGNPDRAMELAFRVSKGGKNFRPWAAYTSGAYKSYLNEASRIAAPASPGATPDTVVSIGAPASVPIVPAGMTTQGPITQTVAPGNAVPPGSYSEDSFPYPHVAGPAGAPAPQAAGQMPAAALPQAPATLPASAPPPVTPYGGVNPAYIQWAQLQSQLLTRRKYPVPAYIAEAAALPLKYAEPAANVPLQGRIAGERKGAEHQYDVLRDTLKANLDRRNALAAQGAQFGSGGAIAPVPGFSETIAGTKGAEAAAVSAAREAAQLQREQAMARFNVNPNAIGSQAPADLGGGMRSGGALPGGAAPAPAAAPSYGPGATEPLPTPHGTVIPPITEAAPIAGSPKYLEQRQTGKGGWAETEGLWSESRAPMKRAEEAAFAVADVLKRYQSGAFAGQLSDIRAKLRAVGIDLPESLAGDPAAAQKIIKENFSQTISSLKGFDSNPAVYQIKLAFENWANTNLQPEANLAIIAKSIGMARWQEKLQQDFGEAKKFGWRDPQDFMLKWDQRPENSLLNFVTKAEQEIGPLKGAPGGPPGGAPKRSYYDPATGTLRPME